MSLDTILASGEMLECTVEIDSAHRVTGALVTWYYSTLFRETGSTDTPVNAPFPRYLVSVGPLAQGLAEDILFSGLSTNDPGTVVLFQPLPAIDKLSQLNNYTFIGYECRIKLGLASSALYSDFVRYRTTTIAAEPDVILSSRNGVGGIQATFKLQSVLGRMLEEQLIVKHYHGIPNCLRFMTATGLATVTKVAAHDVSRFTVAIKFRMSTAPGTVRRLWTKFVSTTTDAHWFIRIETTGKVLIISTSGGATNINYTSLNNLCDGYFHTISLSRNAAAQYDIMIDNTAESSGTATGAVNLSNANLVFGLSSGGDDVDIVDARFYNRYIPPDELRGLLAIRSDGDDLNTIGLWRFDDNAGGNVNDYSSTAADAVITGTVNVDYSWQPSDLGEPELAGRPYPIVIGEVLNAPAQMIRGIVSGVGDRFRFNDGPTAEISAGIATLTLKSQGTVLTNGVNYTAPTGSADSVIPMLTGESEPITFDHRSNGTAEEQLYISKIFQRILVERTRLTISNIDTSRVDSLTVLCPWLSGYFSDSDTNAQSALQEILGQSGLCDYEDSIGRITPDFFLPPCGYGPYDEPLVDFHGEFESGYQFTGAGSISGSCTLCCWVHLHLIDQTTYSWLTGAEPNAGTIYLLLRTGTSSNIYDLYFQSIGPNAGKIAFKIAGNTLYSPAGLFELSGKYFIAAVFDDVANTYKIYVAREEGTLLEVASGSNTGIVATGTGVLVCGGGSGAYSWLAMQHVQVWNVAKNLSQLQALMADPPAGNEANLVSYVPMNEGTGNPLEVVLGTSGIPIGSSSPKWAPRLTVNLNDTPSVRLVEFHHLKPVYDLKVNYAKNRSPMMDADIDTSIVGDDRIELKRPSKQVPFNDPDIRSRFKDARQVKLDSSITDRESVQNLLRALVSRFGTDKYIIVLEFPPRLNISRQACGLKLLDEIGIIGTFPEQINIARSFRVISVSHNPITLSTSIGFTG